MNKSETTENFFKLDKKAAGIYRITRVDTGDFYIGSSINLYNRWKTHKSSLLKNRHGNSKLQNLVNKYGISIFEFEIICVLPFDKTLLLLQEQFFIDKLSPTLNLSYTAKGTHTKTTEIPVYQYSLHGKYLEGYPSISEASRIVKIDCKVIERVLKGNKYTAANYRWSLQKVTTLPTLNKDPVSMGNTVFFRCVPYVILQKDKLGTLLRVWDSKDSLLTFYSKLTIKEFTKLVKHKRSYYKTYFEIQIL